jgi:anhydro-N-acetylmuramic acid kinase
MHSAANKSFLVTGIMSGTSLDGLDLAACCFHQKNGCWEYGIEHVRTYAYTDFWKTRLASLREANAIELAKAHFEYGKLLAEFVNHFHDETNFKPDLIASHGHTIFHNPDNGFTMQIGSGAVLASLSGKPVVCDFRSSDIGLGGQGAPLVPIGDELLFSQYDACLNLGGFSNISLKYRNQRIAFDICPVNTVLNMLAGKMGLPFDAEGNLAANGNIHPEILAKLNKLSFYSRTAPKSLGIEWVYDEVLPILNSFEISAQDLLRTFTEHIAIQISNTTARYGIHNLLVTGGGAYNTFLLKRITKLSTSTLMIPDKETIEFKEAIIFAFLGLLRWLEQPNCLATATGASANAIGGAVYLPAK